MLAHVVRSACNHRVLVAPKISEGGRADFDSEAAHRRWDFRLSANIASNSAPRDRSVPDAPAKCCNSIALGKLHLIENAGALCVIGQLVPATPSVNVAYVAAIGSAVRPNQK